MDYSTSVDAAAFTTSRSTTSVAFTGTPNTVGASLTLVAGWHGFFEQPFNSTPQNSIWNRRIPLVNGVRYREQANTFVNFGQGRHGANGYVMTTTVPRNGATEDFGALPPMLNVLGDVSEPSGARRLTWTASGPVPMGVDGIIVGFSGGSGYGWNYILPPSATSVVRPELPDEFASYRTRVQESSDVRMLDATDLSGYAEFRSGRHPVRDLGDFMYELPTPAGPADGTRWNWGFGDRQPF